MGLEDELDSRFSTVSRTPSYVEAERLVGEAYSQLAEVAHILAKRGVPTETIETWPERVFDSPWKRVFGTYRPTKAADGWELFEGFSVDTNGRPWRREWTHHPWESENYPSSFDQQLVASSEWVKSLSYEFECSFSLGNGKVEKCYIEDGQAYLVLVPNDPTGKGPFKDVLLRLTATLLRRAAK
ncbi:hypothetical protein [Pseudarthrobacter albicanus]|uniref:hypothetical protein n=1 Tax=Pseudarthrobacter albicanus TaxID=2823873 RepID=UPI001BA7DFE8|nr:hypothetical protein [Pseudarthrobacter albicanus]